MNENNGNIYKTFCIFTSWMLDYEFKGILLQSQILHKPKSCIFSIHYLKNKFYEFSNILKLKLHIY